MVLVACKKAMRLTDRQWELLEPFFKPELTYTFGRPCRHPREVLDGILWILRTGAQWCCLPHFFPPYQTCHRWFQRWNRDGRMERVVKQLARDLEERGGLTLDDCFIDGTFVPAKKGGTAWGKPSGARVRRSWQLQTALVFLSPYARTLLRRTNSPSLKKPSTTVLPDASPSA
jgi:transposase